MQKVFFLDRDGVLNHDLEGICKPEHLIMCEGVPEALKKIKAAGYGIVVVSNQAGIANGVLSWEDLKQLQKHFEGLLKQHNAPLPDKWYYCPHSETGIVPEYAISCDCRKPKPGMIIAAKQDLNIDCENSFFIGDRITDIQCGLAGNCKAAVLVMSGFSKLEDAVPLDKPYYTAAGILEAVEMLLKKFEDQ